jgi:hypothetical protein
MILNTRETTVLKRGFASKSISPEFEFGLSDEHRIHPTIQLLARNHNQKQQKPQIELHALRDFESLSEA